MPKKEKQGIVISDKMDKTVVVKVASYELTKRTNVQSAIQ